MGFIHYDKIGRDSLALDILETIRPIIDSYVIGLLGSRAFTYRDFTESSGGRAIPGRNVPGYGPADS